MTITLIYRLAPGEGPEPKRLGYPFDLPNIVPYDPKSGEEPGREHHIKTKKPDFALRLVNSIPQIEFLDERSKRIAHGQPLEEPAPAPVPAPENSDEADEQPKPRPKPKAKAEKE